MPAGFSLIPLLKDAHTEKESQEGVIALEPFPSQLKNMVIMKKAKVVLSDLEHLYRPKVKYVVEFKAFIFYDIFLAKTLSNLSQHSLIKICP